MNYKEGLSIGGNVFSYILSAVQTNEVFQIISMVLSVLTSLVILSYKVWSWFKEAKKDGKIDKEEVDQLGEILEDTKKDLEDKSKDEH